MANSAGSKPAHNTELFCSTAANHFSLNDTFSSPRCLISKIMKILEQLINIYNNSGTSIWINKYLISSLSDVLPLTALQIFQKENPSSGRGRLYFLEKQLRPG